MSLLISFSILDRDTPTAKIFVTKSEHDFRYSMVVSQWTKGMAWLGVLLLNLFFIYFSMLRGLQRGHDWQLMYLTACVVQFSIEVVFYETSECALIHYLIPDLARNEIHSVQFVLHKAIESLWGDVPGNELLLNAPEYLFVSTQLANAFPNLLESMVVRSYFSFSPGELSKKWRISHFSMSSPLSMWSWSRGRVRRFTVTALTTAMLQYLGAFSPTLQRVMIHSLQPLVLSAIYFMFDLLLRHPLYFIPFGSVVLYVVYRLLEGEYRRRNQEMEEGRQDIRPLQVGSVAEMNIYKDKDREKESSLIPPASSSSLVLCEMIGGDEEAKSIVESEVEVDGSEDWEVDVQPCHPYFVSSSESEGSLRGSSSSRGVEFVSGIARKRKSRGYSEDSALWLGSDISDNFSSLQDERSREESSGVDQDEEEDDSEDLSCSDGDGFDLSSDEEADTEGGSDSL
jgi:hypothetical protein